MGLFVNMKEGVLVVRDEMYSFDGTHVSWWYHDLENRVSSSDGNEGGDLDRPMDDDAYAWVCTHYLPLLRGHDPFMSSGKAVRDGSPDDTSHRHESERTS